MSLVTTCPSCGTSFRITPEQLAAHRGDVRCGHCQHIFSALKQLEEIVPPTPQLTEEEAAPFPVQPETDLDTVPSQELPTEIASEQAPVVEIEPETPITDAPELELTEPEPIIEPPPSVEVESHADEESLPEVHDLNIDDEALDLDTNTLDLEIPPIENAKVQDESEQPEQPLITEDIEEIELTNHSEWNEETSAVASPVEPAPLQAQQQEITAPPAPDIPPVVAKEESVAPRRSKTWLVAALALLLALVAIAQTAYSLRNNIASHYPQATHLLESLCRPFGCSIDLPRQVDLLSIEDSDLKDDPEHEGVLILVSILDNRASFTQALPLLELTLTDTFDHPVLRRTFTPKEYLPSGMSPERGIAAGAQIPIRLNLGVEGTKPAGYRLYVKY